MRAPRGLGHDEVRHQPLEHPAAERRHEGQVCPGIGVVALPHRKAPPRLRIGDRHPGAGPRLATRGRVAGTALRWRRPPGAPPDITGHLIAPHADVHGDPRVAVERAVVVAGRTLVDVVAAVHLAGRRVTGQPGVRVAVGLRAVVVEDGEVHRGQERTGRPALRGQGAADLDQPGGEPAVVDRGDEPAVVLGRSGLRAVTLAGIGQHLPVARVVPLIQEAVVAAQRRHLAQGRPRELHRRGAWRSAAGRGPPRPPTGTRRCSPPRCRRRGPGPDRGCRVAGASWDRCRRRRSATWPARCHAAPRAERGAATRPPPGPRGSGPAKRRSRR